MFSTPEVSGDLLYIGSCAGVFYALDKSDGSVVWSYDISVDGDQNSFHGGMLVTDELVLIGTDSPTGHVYAFEKNDGGVRWRYPVVGAGAATDLVRSGTRVLTVVDKDHAICLGLESGDLLWNFADPFDGDIPLLMTQSAAVAADRLFFGGHAGRMNALDIATGDILWTTDIGARISTSVVAVDGAVYFGAVDYHIYRLSQKTGEVMSNFTTESVPTGRPTITDGAIYFFFNEDEELGPGQAIDLLALNHSLEKILWQEHPDFVWSATKSHAWNDVLVTGTQTGELVAYDLHDGELRWTFEVGGAIRSIGSEGDTLYIGTLEGSVYAVGTRE